ncbi:hypothetical protein ASPBRDRAFT_195413 [Aspergillus brasiliensis CBS 101740]|uniref:DUF7924 domain-containing protein n=1 Tax=Aspergillus brasiliensis (strain CBS 101740 / IMI 381727 / IBT 21946) TaxID=767769 RepID=A0A1L9UM51_ASPBC|nr:hypothetical protein ASPBRDRAFT_195413 [Aspergillus brasiliensis CBS 101740]
MAQKKLTSTEKQEFSPPANQRTESQTEPSANRQKKRKAPTPAPASVPASAPAPAPASQHSQRQHKKPRQQQDPDVSDPVSIDQEFFQALLRTAWGSSIHYWIRKVRWPKSLFNNDIDHIIISPRESSEPMEEQDEEEDGFMSKYNNPHAEAYAQFKSYLQANGSYLWCHSDDMAAGDRKICEELLKRECETPVGTAFDEKCFAYITGHYGTANENGITRIVGQLIVPSAVYEILSGRLSSNINHIDPDDMHLVESIYEPWNASITLEEHPSLVRNVLYEDSDPWLTYPTPQPYYAVGFSYEAFSKKQLCKLEPHAGDLLKASSFKGTETMLFPFFVTEVMGASAIKGILELQIAHSMTRALRGVVELFKLVGRQDELHRRVLGFSVCHDICRFDIFAHYVVIRNNKATYYRHTLDYFDIGCRSTWYEDRWKCYKFVMALYHDWVPIHHQRLCSAIDSLPDLQPHT